MLSHLIKIQFEKYKIKCNLYQALDGLDAVLNMSKKISKMSIIFMDNIMPNLAGPLTAKIIRALGYRNLIIGITGNAVDSDVFEFYESGVDYVFIKPFNKSILNSVIELTQKYTCESFDEKHLIFNSGVLEWVDNEPLDKPNNDDQVK